jgi:hypothetical protein
MPLSNESTLLKCLFGPKCPYSFLFLTCHRPCSSLPDAWVRQRGEPGSPPQQPQPPTDAPLPFPAAELTCASCPWPTTELLHHLLAWPTADLITVPRSSPSTSWPAAGLARVLLPAELAHAPLLGWMQNLPLHEELPWPPGAMDAPPPKPTMLVMDAVRLELPCLAVGAPSPLLPFLLTTAMATMLSLLSVVVPL